MCHVEFFFARAFASFIVRHSFHECMTVIESQNQLFRDDHLSFANIIDLIALERHNITSKVRLDVAEVVSNFIREMDTVANNNVSDICLVSGFNVGIMARHDARRGDRCN